MENAKRLSHVKRLLGPEMWELLVELEKQPWHTKLHYDSQESSMRVGKPDEWNAKLSISRCIDDNNPPLYMIHGISNGRVALFAFNIPLKEVMNVLHREAMNK